MSHMRKFRGSLAPSPLLLRFLAAASVVLAISGVVLGLLLTRLVQREMTAAYARNTAHYVSASFDPFVDKSWQRDSRLSDLAHSVQSYFATHKLGLDIVAIKVWDTDGTIVHSNQKAAVGKRFPIEGDLRAALSGRVDYNMSNLDKPENQVERRSYDRLLEVYAPVRLHDGRIVGAFEVYQDLTPLDARLRRVTIFLWLGVAICFLFLLASLSWIVGGASRTVTTRNLELKDSYSRLEQSYLESINSLSAALEAKDRYTRGHSKRVGEIALAIGRHVGLSDEKLRSLELAGMFHDLGKIAIPESILNKPGKLTDKEFARIKKHPGVSRSILQHLGFLDGTLDVVLHHHERWDGTGYPSGLAGEAIPLQSRILAVADTYDALTSARSYRGALSHDAAVEIITNVRGSQLCPSCVDAFLALYGTADLAVASSGSHRRSAR